MKLDYLAELGVENQENLYLGGKQIQNLKNIQKYDKVETLWLDENPLGSLNNIQSLRLKTLNVDYAEISSLKPLRNMTSLEELTADSNKISDLRPLRLLVNLRVVDLSFNKISSLSGIEGLVNLEKLDLDKNMIADF